MKQIHQKFYLKKILKIIKNSLKKIKKISNKGDAIHLTENVLRTSKSISNKSRKDNQKQIPNLPITVSLRVRDKSEKEISEFVDNCINGF